jgi:hypothetical protein
MSSRSASPKFSTIDASFLSFHQPENDVHVIDNGWWNGRYNVVISSHQSHNVAKLIKNFSRAHARRFWFHQIVCFFMAYLILPSLAIDDIQSSKFVNLKFEKLQ